jgi:Mce-associated membrane protein
VAGLRKRARAEDPEEHRGEATADSAAEEPASEASAAEPGSESPSEPSSEAVAEQSAAEASSAPETSEESEEVAVSSSASATEETPSAADTPPETAGDAEPDADSQADSESGASTPGAIKPRGKTGSSETARPTGRGKRKGTRVGAARSEAAELPRAKPVEGSATAVADREDTATTEAQAQSSDGAEDGRAWMRDRRVWFLGSLGLSVVFGLIAVLFGALSLGYLGGSQANEALTDQATTSEVNGQVTDAVNKVFSYDFANTKKTEDAAHQFLTGKAIQQYNDLFATVKQQAPQQKLVVTTTVKTSGVTRLQGDHAQVLLFVDQNATRTTTGENNVGPAQISVGAVKDGDQWKIDSITQR